MQRGKERFAHCSGFESGFPTCGSNLGYCLDFVPPLHSPRLPPFQLLWKHGGAFLIQKLTSVVASALLDVTLESSPAPSLTSFKTTEVFPEQPMH